MRDELKAERERRAQAHYQQVRLFADKHGKKPSMAYMSTKEKYPNVFIPPEWQNAPTPVGIDLDPDFEQELRQARRLGQGQREEEGDALMPRKKTPPIENPVIVRDERGRLQKGSQLGTLGNGVERRADPVKQSRGRRPRHSPKRCLRGHAEILEVLTKKAIEGETRKPSACT